MKSNAQKDENTKKEVCFETPIYCICPANESLNANKCNTCVALQYLSGNRLPHSLGVKIIFAFCLDFLLVFLALFFFIPPSLLL